MANNIRSGNISSQIIAIRAAHGGSADTCPTCCRAASAPYRKYDSGGQVEFGCVDAAHEPYMTAAYSDRISIDWHFRKAAVDLRKAELAALR